MKTSYLTGQSLDFREPKEPNIPKAISTQEESFNKTSYKLKPEDRKKELAMNEARKRLENNNLESMLFGKAKEKARERRLNNKLRYARRN